MRGDEIVDHLAAHVGDGVAQIGVAHQLEALLEDRLALIVHHVVVFEQVLADVEVARLDLGLRLLQRLVDPGMDDRLVLFQAERLQHAVHALRAEDAHEIVLERQEEARAARIALAAGAAAELIVDAPALMALGADDVEAAGFERLRFFSADLGGDGVALRAICARSAPCPCPSPRRSSPRAACRGCRRAECRCRGRPCWWRWSRRRARRPGR